MKKLTNKHTDQVVDLMDDAVETFARDIGDPENWYHEDGQPLAIPTTAPEDGTNIKDDHGTDAK